MQSRFDHDYVIVFVVDQDAITKIYSLLKSKICDPEITIECVGNVTHTMNSVSKLFEYANSKEKKIRKLTLSAHLLQSPSKNATIVFNGKNSFSRGVSIKLEARNDLVENMKKSILDIIDGVKPWYHHAPKLDFIVIGMGVLFCTSMILNILKVQGYISVTEENKFDISELNLFIIGTLLCLVFLYSLNRVRDLIFPKSIFLIGNEIKRYETIKNFQWVVGIGGVLSIVVGSAFAILT